MEKRISYIQLFLFLILSALLLLFFIPFDEILQDSNSGLIIEANIEDEIDYSNQGFQTSPTIEVYNERFKLYYSLNGGESFFVSNSNSLNINELTNWDIKKYKTSIRWKSPGFGLPEMKNVVVKLIDENNRIETNEKSITYYSTEISQLPIVHLTIANGDLFDWNNGIMIAGAAGTSSKLFYQNWWYRPANFALRGYASARDVYFQYFKNGGLIYESAAQVKISGNATRYFPQKSLKIRAFDENGRKSKFELPFWGKDGNKKYESLVLRQSGNDNISTLFADLLMHELALESKVVILNGFPVSVFINGNYWGIYNLRERIDEYMLSKRVDADSKDITILRCEKSANIYRLVAGKENEKQEFENLIQLINEDGSISDNNYLKLSESISLKSFIDYIFFETYYANQDWLSNNTTWFKAKGGQWKWVLNDLDFSLAYPGEANVNSNLFDRLLAKNSIMGKLFSALLTVDEFKEKFLKRSEKHLNEIFNEVNVTEKFNQLKSKYEGDIQYEIDRWRSIDSYAAWEASCEANLNFLINRKSIYLKQLEDL